MRKDEARASAWRVASGLRRQPPRERGCRRVATAREGGLLTHGCRQIFWLVPRQVQRSGGDSRESGKRPGRSLAGPAVSLFVTSASERHARIASSRISLRRRKGLTIQRRNVMPMRWRERIHNERGSIGSHAPRSLRETDPEYAFDPEKYPALAKAADEWSDRCTSRLEKLRKKIRRSTN